MSAPKVAPVAAPAVPIAPAAPTGKLPSVWLLEKLTWLLARLAPIPATNAKGIANPDAGTVPVSIHQSYAVRLNGAPDASGAPTVVTFPGPAALYSEAVRLGQILPVAVPTYSQRPKLDVATGLYAPAVVVAGSVRVPSFIEAVTAAHASGDIVATGYGFRRRLTLPGKMTARTGRKSTADVAAALAQMEG